MSVIQLLVMQPERCPQLADVREAALSEDTPYRPDDADLATHTGFLPVAVGEQQTGFEYYFEPIEAGQLPDEATRHGSHQMISRTGSDMAEMLASMLFFRTTAKLAGAAYVYPDDGIIVPPDQVDEYLSAQIKQLRKFLK
jgi:hypothetical protein